MPSFPPALLTLQAIRAVQDELQRAMEADVRLAAYSNSEKILLTLLLRPMRMGEVAQALHCLPSNVTALVDQLEARNLLRREACPDDRRAKRIVLTEEGRNVRATLVDAISDIVADVTGLAPSEMDELLTLLNRRRVPGNCREG